MTTLYNGITILSFTLLAVLIPVFVFAVSLLGRAIESASEEYKKKESILKGKIRETSIKWEASAKKMRETGKTAELEKDIKTYKRETKKYTKSLKDIKNMPEYLTVKGCILKPGFFFLLAFVLNNSAKYLPNMQYKEQIVILLTFASIIMLFNGFRILYLCLNIVQQISLTTDEAQFRRMVEAFEAGLEKHEAKKIPELELEFVDNNPPFRFAKSSEVEIKNEISLNSGYLAEDVEVFFFVPKEFLILGTKSSISYYKKEYNECFVKLGNIKSGIMKRGSLKIKTPANSGKFLLGYSLLCTGFNSGVQEFEVEIN